MTAESNPLWEFALATYAKPDVADQLLALQDECGADVVLLLTAAWYAVQGRGIGTDTVAVWQEATRHCRRLVQQQRILRRELRELCPDSPQYEAAKTLELSLERWQADILVALPINCRAVETPTLRHNLAAVLQCAMGPAAAAAAARRLGALVAGASDN